MFFAANAESGEEWEQQRSQMVDVGGRMIDASAINRTCCLYLLPCWITCTYFSKLGSKSITRYKRYLCIYQPCRSTRTNVKTSRFYAADAER